MRNLEHSDNLCTVGWTQIHGLMNADDLQLLFDVQPKGHFTPTFYETKLTHWPECTVGNVRDLFGGKEMGYYFAFPLDEQGVALLALLHMLGMEPLEELRFGKEAGLS